MKKNLDLNRLGMVIRWDVLNNWTYNLGIIAGLAICFSIANIIRLYRISGFIAASHELDALTTVIRNPHICSLDSFLLWSFTYWHLASSET